MGKAFVMSEDPDLTEAIEEAANSPRRAKGDEGEFESHSLPDLIQADNHLASKRAGRNPIKAMRMSKIVPPGAT
jgi:hypothetical protein